MSTNRFLTIINGAYTLIQAIAASAGAADASKILMTDSSGRIDTSFMPSGIGAQTLTGTALEALAAGDWVNVTPTGVRKADNSNNRPAHGFVLSAVASSATAIVFTSGLNTGKTTLTVGSAYFLGTAGSQVTTPPSTAGTIYQSVGIAVNATTIPFDYDTPISIV